MQSQQATIKDIPRLNLISVESKKHWGYPDDWIEHWRPDLTVTRAFLKENHVLKLVLEGEIRGFCAISESPEQYEIEHLWVQPAFIGKGLGKFLLEASLEKVVRRPIDIVVVADPNAEGFYTSQGFVTFNAVESYPKGRFLPLMRKSLTP